MSRLTGINHITLACSDLEVSVAFYTDVLGARLRARWARGAYFDLGSLWLCLDVGVVQPRDDYTHVALDCSDEDFPALAHSISQAAPLWKGNKSEGSSLYFLDPDGHRLEVHAGTIASRLQAYAHRTDITIYD